MLIFLYNNLLKSWKHRISYDNGKNVYITYVYANITAQ